MNWVDIPGVIRDVFYGVWLALVDIYDGFGLGMKVVCTLILILFIIYLLLDISCGIIRLVKYLFGYDDNGGNQ